MENQKFEQSIIYKFKNNNVKKITNYKIFIDKVLNYNIIFKNITSRKMQIDVYSIDIMYISYIKFKWTYTQVIMWK
jgi:hypothetical protein